MSPRKNATPSQLGNHIIRRRRLRGWRTADLASAAELPYTTVRNVEKGYSRKPSEAILRALIKALDCDEGVVFAYAGYGVPPVVNEEERHKLFAKLGEDAPLWEATIRDVEDFMTPEEQMQALTVLRAQLASAADRRSKGSR